MSKGAPRHKYLATRHSHSPLNQQHFCNASTSATGEVSQQVGVCQTPVLGNRDQELTLFSFCSTKKKKNLHEHLEFDSDDVVLFFKLKNFGTFFSDSLYFFLQRVFLYGGDHWYAIVMQSQALKRRYYGYKISVMGPNVNLCQANNVGFQKYHNTCVSCQIQRRSAQLISVAGSPHKNPHILI